MNATGRLKTGNDNLASDPKQSEAFNYRGATFLKISGVP